jgi:hypothetical protein
MKKLFLLLVLPMAFILTQCKPNENAAEKGSVQFIKQVTIDSVAIKLATQFGDVNKTRIEKGVRQCAALWTAQDGTDKDFEAFCLNNFVGDPAKLEYLFKRLSANWESLFGHFNMISLDLKRGMHLDIGEMLDIDELFGAYEPGSHFNDDFSTTRLHL